MRGAPNGSDDVVRRRATLSLRGRGRGADHGRRGQVVPVIAPSLRHDGPAGSPVGPIARR